jgi:DNA modification methylase
MLEVNKIYQGDALEVLKTFPDECINCCVTSPPYWALRDYGVEGQLGLEPDFNEYINKLCDIFDEVKRVLRNDGTLWVNMGDTYGGSGNSSGHKENTKNCERKTIKYGASKGNQKSTKGLEKSLCNIPARFSIEMQNRGWILRNVIIWCLDKDTRFFVKDNSVFKKICISDMKEGMFVPTQNMNGDFVWVKVKNVFNNGQKECIKIRTKTGREVICSKEHKFVVKKSTTIGGRFRKIKVVDAEKLELNDYLYVNEEMPLTDLPYGNKGDYEDGFIIGFFLAEGSYIKNKVGNYKNNKFSEYSIRRWGHNPLSIKNVGVQFSCGKTDIERGYINFLKKYNIKEYHYGNCVYIYSRDKQLLNMISSFIDGEYADKKHLTNLAFNKSLKFIEGILDGFLAGDGSYDKKNDRNRSSICINKNLIEDIQLLCRILGYQFRVSFHSNDFKGVCDFSIRKKTKQKRIFGCITDRIEKIECVGKRDVFDIEIEPIYYGGKGNNQFKKEQLPSMEKRKNKYNNLYFLSNGIWTHNCKPNCMPSSVKDRFTVDFEYVYFFVKNKKYWFEQQIENKGSICERKRKSAFRLQNENNSDKIITNGRNKRAVWSVTTKPYKEAHFATYPKELIEPMIKAGCPEFVCNKCGFAKKKIIEKIGDTADKTKGNYAIEMERIGNLQKSRASGFHNKIEIKEKGYTSCNCNEKFSGGIVLDPFFGSGTTGLVALEQNKKFIGIELNNKYIEIANKRLNPVLNQTKL